MIFLWGLPSEAPISAVSRNLQRLGRRVAFVDQSLQPRLDVDLSCDSGIVSGSIKLADQVVDLGRVSSAYLRPYDVRRLPQVERAGMASSVWRHACDVDDLLWTWAELTTAVVVNRPSCMASNNSKPYQLSILQQYGLATPDTIVTTSAEAVLDFLDEHRKIVYKSVSGTRSIVQQFENIHVERLGLVGNCPTQFQQYVPGVDYRVHVVGRQLFTCRITSSATDYRYADSQGVRVVKERVEIPDEVSDCCLKLASGTGLLVAGIDLRRSPDGAWYCFEINPSPAFSYFDVDDEVARAIALLLAAA